MYRDEFEIDMQVSRLLGKIKKKYEISKPNTQTDE